MVLRNVVLSHLTWPKFGGDFKYNCGLLCKTKDRTAAQSLVRLRTDTTSKHAKTSSQKGKQSHETKGNHSYPSSRNSLLCKNNTFLTKLPRWLSKLQQSHGYARSTETSNPHAQDSTRKKTARCFWLAWRAGSPQERALLRTCSGCWGHLLLTRTRLQEMVTVNFFLISLSDLAKQLHTLFWGLEQKVAGPNSSAWSDFFFFFFLPGPLLKNH